MAMYACSRDGPRLQPYHLKPCRDTHGGFLMGGKHYILGLGASHSAAIVWIIDAISTAFHYRGMLRHRG